MRSHDVLVIGGGIIGSALALRLADAKLSVTVLERGEPGREASWAAAGMLAPTGEAGEALDAGLGAASAVLYPQWLERLGGHTKLDVGYRTEGTLDVAFTEAEAETLKSLPGERLTAAEARRLEPALPDRIVAAVFLPRDVQVDNRRLFAALLEAARAAGVRFRTGTNVEELVTEGGRATGVRTTASETIAAGIVVNAAGCWASQLGEHGRRLTPTRPVRGQMIALRGDAEKPLLRHVVRSPRGYILPRSDPAVGGAGDRLVCGSTSENAGYDKSLTSTGLRQILSAAIELVPPAASLPFADAWAGLRPDSPDHLPILGATDIEGYFVATGHYRNGILLAPITAQLVGDVILGRKPSLSLEPFSPLRFVPSDRRPVPSNQ
ncbi:MAG: glycine oxidase ThiO [Candidatus Acidiferrales bacterium]